MIRDQELWAIALWVEKQHGANAARSVAEQINRMVAGHDDAGAAKWRAVSSRLQALKADHLDG